MALMSYKLNFLAVLILLCPVTLTAKAQNVSKPNLSGTWRLNTHESKMASGAAPRADVVEVAESGSSITITLTIDGKQTTHLYTANGKERVERVPNGAPSASQVVSKASWTGSSLVTELIIRLTNPLIGNVEVERSKDTWTASSDGNALTRVTESKNFPSETLKYDKQ